METAARNFISYRTKEPDLGLAQEFFRALEAARHLPFMAAASITWGEDWVQRVDKELAASDYLLLLLSDGAATSEMVIEEVRSARELRSKNRKPLILPVRLNPNVRLNYQLRSYLQHIQQEIWQGPSDTQRLVSTILEIVNTRASLESKEALESEAPNLDDGTKRPLPMAEPEIPAGQVKLASKFYLEREVESRCYKAIQQTSALIRIKAPRQTGKTSLLARILYHAKENGYSTVSINFQLLGASSFGSLQEFLVCFCEFICYELQIDTEKGSKFWNTSRLPLIVRCTAYFERFIFPEFNGPLVLGIDELEEVFSNEAIAKDFLSMLRAWNERTKANKLWHNFRLVVAHSTELYVQMDTNSSPFNVGLPVNLSDFTAEQVQDLAQKHGLNWNESEVLQLMEMIGGHPYLVRLSLYEIALGKTSLPKLLGVAATEAGLFADHLRRHLWKLEQNADLFEAMKQVVASDEPVCLNSIQAFKLEGMGLINLNGNQVTPRYLLHRRYFQTRLKGR